MKSFLSWKLLLLSVFAHTVVCAADEANWLYRASPLVTGTEAAERARGFQMAMTEVLIRLTGRQDVLNRPAIQSLLAHASDYVQVYEYEDRLKSIPVHDEQGTRERPHFLHTEFNAERLNAALTQAGLRVWQPQRPRVSVWMRVDTAVDSYLLTDAQVYALSQGGSFADACRRRGIVCVFPDQQLPPTKLQQYDQALFQADIATLNAAAVQQAADVVLLARVTADGQGYWTQHWQVHYQGGEFSWQYQQGSYDEGFRAGIEQLMQVLVEGS